MGHKPVTLPLCHCTWIYIIAKDCLSLTQIISLVPPIWSKPQPNLYSRKRKTIVHFLHPFQFSSYCQHLNGWVDNLVNYGSRASEYWFQPQYCQTFVLNLIYLQVRSSRWKFLPYLAAAKVTSLTGLCVSLSSSLTNWPISPHWEGDDNVSVTSKGSAVKASVNRFNDRERLWVGCKLSLDCRTMLMSCWEEQIDRDKYC